jgi:glutamate synthase (NADPH/NADH) small chain
VLIATGVYKPREVNLPGHDLKNIFPAMEFLTASNRKGLGDKVENFENGTLNAENKNVVVIGGGDTAMDCVRTAIRQNAKSVKCIYRRDKENMPGSIREVNNAEEEGIEFIWLSNPKKFIGSEKISSLLVEKMKLGIPDSSGRKKPEPIPNSDFEIKVDIAIKALGFDPEDLPKLFNDSNLLVSKWGTIKVNMKSMETNIAGVFAAGDIVRGASLVVWAIRDGRDAASSIHNYLENKTLKKIKVA